MKAANNQLPCCEINFLDPVSQKSQHVAQLGNGLSTET